VAVTDHSQSLKVAWGLSPVDVRRKKKELDRLNDKRVGARLLFGAEVDIDNEGNMDYSDSILKEFDIVIAAIHTGLRQSKEQLTRRITTACQNKYVHIIAHPTGRLRGVRESYALDIEVVLAACKKTNTALEVNSYPDRLDCNDALCRQAKEKQVRVAISTDAHDLAHLDYIRYGVAMARRGWLEKKDVINTQEASKLLETIKK